MAYYNVKLIYRHRRPKVFCVDGAPVYIYGFYIQFRLVCVSPLWCFFFFFASYMRFWNGGEAPFGGELGKNTCKYFFDMLTMNYVTKKHTLH